MKTKKTNFVDDVKVDQPVRRSRSSTIDLINGQEESADMAHVEEHLNLLSLGKLVPIGTKPTLTPVSPIDPIIPKGGGIQINPIVPLTPIEGCASLMVISNTGSPGSTRTQVFQVGSIVNDGFVYSVAVYSHTVSVTASGDTPSSIASKLAAAVNATSASQWNDVGSAPNSGTPGFPPNATSSGDTVTITLNYQNQFAGWATGCYTAPVAPPSPPPPVTPVEPQPTPTTPNVAPPASNSTIDTWDCPTLNQNLTAYNQVLADQTISDQTRTDYENALLYINNRINTVCTPTTTPTIETPTSAPPPLPSYGEIDAMNCDQLNALKTSLVTNESSYRFSAETLQNYINVVNNVDLQFTKKCKTTTAPTVEVYAPGAIPYKASGSVGGGGAGRGSSSSSTAAKPITQQYKKWWWIGVIVVVGALILYKPGTKAGVIAK